MEDLKLSKKELYVISMSLIMRKNYIETNDISISASDCQNMLEHWDGKGKDPCRIKALTTDQYALILDIESIYNKIQEKLNEH